MINTVTKDNYCVSYVTGSNIKGVLLQVFTVNKDKTHTRMDDYNKPFPDKESAQEYALSKGYIQIYKRKTN
jgi:hypothetical protein